MQPNYLLLFWRFPPGNASTKDSKLCVPAHARFAKVFSFAGCSRLLVLSYTARDAKGVIRWRGADFSAWPPGPFTGVILPNLALSMQVSKWTQIADLRLFYWVLHKAAPKSSCRTHKKTRHKNPPQPGRPSAYLLVRMLPMAAMTAGETIPKSAAPHWAGRLFFHDNKMPAFLPPQFRQKRLLFEAALLIIFL